MTLDNNKPVIIVAGLGRCGSSLTMQMLHAGGFTCLGEAPIFELDNCTLIKQNPSWLSHLSNVAIKILQPDLFKFQNSDYTFIWLERDPFECAKSTVKFSLYSGLSDKLTTSKDIAKYIVYLKKEHNKTTQHNLDVISKLGKVFVLNFEDLIMYPKESAIKINRIVDFNLDIDAMVKAVVFRSVKCLSDMDLEMRLIKKADKNNE